MLSKKKTQKEKKRKSPSQLSNKERSNNILIWCLFNIKKNTFTNTFAKHAIYTNTNKHLNSNRKIDMDDNTEQ